MSPSSHRREIDEQKHRSSKSKNRFVDAWAKHFDRIRIEKELSYLFDDSDDEVGDNDIVDICSRGSLLPLHEDDNDNNTSRDSSEINSKTKCRDQEVVSDQDNNNNQRPQDKLENSPSLLINPIKQDLSTSEQSPIDTGHSTSHELAPEIPLHAQTIKEHRREQDQESIRFDERSIQFKKGSEASTIDGFSVIEPIEPIQNKIQFSSYYDQKEKDEEPPNVLILSIDSTDVEIISSTSMISYDDTNTITPSIAFFLGGNTQPLNIGNNPIEDTSITSLSQYYTAASISPNSNDHKHYHSIISNRSSESKTRGSSKYTHDSMKILELKDKKRSIEHVHEGTYNTMPRRIEFDKY